MQLGGVEIGVLVTYIPLWEKQLGGAFYIGSQFPNQIDLTFPTAAQLPDNFILSCQYSSGGEIEGIDFPGLFRGLCGHAWISLCFYF